MKNIFKIPILILLAVLFSCNKKDISSNYEVKTFRKAPDAIEALIKNPNNIEDENLNKFLYNYARAILNVVNYPDLLKIIINESKKSEDNVIQINSLYDINVAILKLVYQYFINNNILFSKEDFPYIPQIYAINANTCDINESPIIAIGTEFFSLDATLEDYIPAWIIDDEDTLEIVLSEEDALEASNPVLIITNDMAQYKKGFKEIFNPFEIHDETNKGGVKNSASKRYFLSQYQIDFRYDASNHSEYEIKYAVAEVGGSFFEQTPFRIANVHKDNIGQSKDCWKELFNNRYNSAGQLISNTFDINKNYKICGVTYEYDWYAPKRPIIAYPCSFECKMKYSNEFYQIIGNVGIVFGNGSNLDISGKGYIRLHRND